MMNTHTMINHRLKMFQCNYLLIINYHVLLLWKRNQELFAVSDVESMMSVALKVVQLMNSEVIVMFKAAMNH